MIRLCVSMIVLSLASCGGCDPNSVVLGPKDDCETGAMRCNGNLVEACGSDQRWVTSMDCDEVAAMSGGQWTCDDTDTDSGPFCAPLDADGGEHE